MRITLSTLIQQVAEEKPNAFKPAKLTSFINDIESQVVEDLDTDKEFIPYDYAKDSGKLLIVPQPYARLYKSWLKAQIDFANEDYESYANNLAQHNQDYAEYFDYIVRVGEAVNTTPTRFSNAF